ncbi:MAG: hypothetical protein QW837_09665 [Conexivisphaerales archaeon]
MIALMANHGKGHLSMEMLAKVSDSELTKLYSNALVTPFPLVHEPSGYVPFERIVWTVERFNSKVISKEW